MRRIAIALLVIFNLFAASQGASFFVTFADLPISDPSLISYEPELVAAALGHAYHRGGESMRSFLGSSVLWIAGAALVNLSIAIAALVKPRRREA